ncbi:MAG: ATP-dependent RNA helicase HrpA, partial [Phycisphaeraceae bacterium]
REWADVHRQLKQLAKDAGLKLRQRHDKPEPIHRALLTGLLSHVAMRGSGHEYTGSGGKKLFIWPGSSLFDAKPKWLMAAELVETSRLFARTAAQINPAWIEPVAGHLVKRSYSEPRWQRETGHVMAYEKVSLFGLPLAARRPANYGKVNPAHAREIFIHEGLVEGEYDTHAPFFHHNAELLEKVRTLQAKARRGDILARMQARFDFYDQRLPKTVTSGPDLDTWRKKAERDNPRLLFMSEADLLAGPADEVTEERFPDALEVGGARLPLEYHLEPGTDEDGVTLAVPLETLNQVDDQQIEWLVPGLLEEKVLAMIRSLPKAIRRNFAPAPDWAKRVTARLRFGEGSLRHAVARTLSEFSTAQVPPSAFRMDALPDHLQLAVRAIDDQGEPIATSRDLGELREKFASQAADRFASLGQADLTQEGLTSWSFGELPQSVEVQRGSMQMTGYPALVDEEQSVALRVLDTPQRASFETHRGLRRLFYLQVEPEVRYRVQHLPQLGRLKLQAATLPDQDRLESQLGLLITERAFLTDDQPIRDAAAFEDRLNTGWNRLGKVAHEVAQQITRILDAYQQASLALSEANAPQWQTALQDMRGQLECLVARGFLTQTPYPWLMQYPRYLSGICKRIEKLQTGRLDRDRESYQQLLPHWQRYIQRAQTHAQRGILDIQLVGYRWMIEEYRISLFAQELGTALPVSPRRLEKQWQQVAGE